MAKRKREIRQALMNQLEIVSNDEVLAIHDWCHAEMERRFGTKSRAQAGDAALAEKDDEIAKLRAALETANGVVVSGTLKLVEARSETARLRAGITAAVEGRYERVENVGEKSRGRCCAHFVPLIDPAGCIDCLEVHLFALLDPPPAPDGGEDHHG